MTLNEIMLIIMGILGAYGYYNHQKRKQAENQNAISENLGRDKELKIQQEEVAKAIQDIDAGIAKAKQELEERSKEENLTLKERQDLWKKRFNQ